MSKSGIAFLDKTVVLDNKQYTLDHTVREAFRLDDVVIVLYDDGVYWHNYGKPQTGQFKSLIAVDSNGNKVWTAELPSTDPIDSYTEVLSREPLRVASWSSYICTIDPMNGRILHKVFTK